ncbi:MAG: metallophosphoesterase [Spirochaetes bacterium]|nr:metallophosphoesterase [Spirochaetota bacterium]
MKILCVADEVDLLVYSDAIRERFGEVDLILSAGDLPNEYLGYIASMLNRPLVSVAGNHDHGEEDASGLGRLCFSIRKEAGLSILGIPGSMLYSGGPNQFSDHYMTMRLLCLAPRLVLRRLFKGRGVDIVLAHAPPKGMGDGPDLPHRGFSAFLWLIGLAKPFYFIHGHVHLYDGREKREKELDSTKVVNVYGHSLIILGEEEPCHH